MAREINAVLKGGVESKVIFLDSIEDLKERIKSFGSNVLCVFDENTKPLFNDLEENYIVLPSGEKEKTWESVDKILKKAVSLSLARDSIFIGIGGGVILDMTAFASSIYMRGSRLVLVPTTLLSMVDASLGGKTGIDYQGLKNFVGTFYPASEILISSETLKTLPEKEFINGMGEVVKHALLVKDGKLYNFLVENKDKILSKDKDVVNEMVELSLLVKKEFIEKDPEEKKGIRSFLNLGHTFSHAYESITNYEVSHGEGVIWGTEKALLVGLNLGLTDKDSYEKALYLMDLFYFTYNSKIEENDIPKFIKATKNDKKKSNKSVKYVLLKKIGEPFLIALDDEEVVKVISN